MSKLLKRVNDVIERIDEMRDHVDNNKQQYPQDVVACLLTAIHADLECAVMDDGKTITEQGETLLSIIQKRD